MQERFLEIWNKNVILVENEPKRFELKLPSLKKV
jgi:hypothetical protein